MADFDGVPPSVIERTKPPLQLRIGYSADGVEVQFNQLVGNLRFSEVECLGIVLELLNALREKKKNNPVIVRPS